MMLTSTRLAAIGMALYQLLMSMIFPAGAFLASASRRAQTLAQESARGVSRSIFEKSILLGMVALLVDTGFAFVYIVANKTPCAAQSRLDGALGHLVNLGEIPYIQVLGILEPEHASRFRVQLRESLFEKRRVEIARRFACPEGFLDNRVEVFLFELAMAFARSQLHEACVHREAVKPRGDCALAFETFDGGGYLDENVHEDVFGFVPVPEHSEGEVQDFAAVFTPQHSKRLAAAFPNHL